jgi:hypothetical protein
VPVIVAPTTQARFLLVTVVVSESMKLPAYTVTEAAVKVAGADPFPRTVGVSVSVYTPGLSGIKVRVVKGAAVSAAELAPAFNVNAFVAFAIAQFVGSVALVILNVPDVVVAVPAAATAADESVGLTIEAVIVNSSLFVPVVGVVRVVTVKAKLADPPTATDAVLPVGALITKDVDVKAAFAGTTDKSPNPSEATATADTFFNEIVFTIFLSFSQIKDDLLSGW